MTENDPKPIPRKTPKKKGDGPSMREQILARKRAEGGGAPEETSEPAPKKSAPKSTPRAARGSSKGGASRASGRASAKRGGGDGGEGERKGSRTRRERPQKKKSPVPLIATGAILVGGAVAAFMLMGGGDETPEEVAAGGTEAGGSAEETPAGAAAGGADSGADESAPSTDGGATTAAADDTPAPTEVAEPEAKPEPEPPKEVDLSTLEPFGMPVGATPEQWTKLQEDAALFFDVDAGAAGGRACRRLEAAGKLAWPAILNEMIRLDPANPDDNEQGMLAQRALNVARGSQTSQAFDWRTPDNGVLSEKNLRYNRKLIGALYDSWAKVVADPAHWDRIDKAESTEESKSDAKAKLEEEFEFDPSDLEGLDG